MNKKFITIFLIAVFIAAFLSMSLRWSDLIRTGYISNWLKFLSRNSYMHQRAGYHIMSDSTDTDFGWGIDDTLGRAVKCRYLRNTSGSSVARGDVVVFDQTVFSIVDTVARSGDPDTLTIALSGSSEKNPLDLFVTAIGIANACSTEITGIDYSQSAVTETVITTTASTVFSTTEWDTVSQVILLGSESLDSILVDAYQQSCFTTTTSDNDINKCGVVFSISVEDNKWGLIAYEGRMDSVKCDASSVTAITGRPVTTSNTTKTCEPRSSITAGAVIGRCLEADNTNGRIAIWLGEE